MEEGNVLDIHNLVKYFPIYGGVFLRTIGQVQAVDGISFSIKEKKTLGMVGESGCGKTTAGRCILRLIEPTSGEIYYHGKNILEFNKKQMAEYRRKAQIIFQNPHSSLNPRMTVDNILSEPLRIHKLVPKNEIESHIADLLEKVALEYTHLSNSTLVILNLK